MVENVVFGVDSTNKIYVADPAHGLIKYSREVFQRLAK
jgi:hypothetical protein